MKPFQWDDHYAIGHATIDEQHRKIVDIINLLHEVLNDGAHLEECTGAAKVFDQLAEYVMNHFSYEEQLMLDAGYPVEKVAEHKRTHDTLLDNVQDVMHAYQNGDTRALADLLPFLYGDWLIEHICHTDKDYAPYLQHCVSS